MTNFDCAYHFRYPERYTSDRGVLESLQSRGQAGAQLGGIQATTLFTPIFKTAKSIIIGERSIFELQFILVYGKAKCRGRGRVKGSQPISTPLHRSPNRLWRSNSTFILWF
jgi:hypothetical protein